jgi:hypothetical protein
MATTKTELYNNGTLVATKTSAPFNTFDWTPASGEVGLASLTVKRYEDGVLVATSAAVGGTVDAAAGAFEVSYISNEHYYLPLDYENMTATEGNPNVTGVTDVLTTTPYTFELMNYPQKATVDGKEAISNVVNTGAYLRTTYTVDYTPLFNGTYSVSFAAKLKEGRPATTSILWGAYKGQSDRMILELLPTGAIRFRLRKANVDYTADGGVLLAAGEMPTFKRFTIVVNAGVTLKLYLDDTEVASTDISALDLSTIDYTNSIVTLMGGTYNGGVASYVGYYRQYVIQDVAYTVSDIQNLMTL